MENLKIDLNELDIPDLPEPDYKQIVKALGLPENSLGVTAEEYMQASDIVLQYLTGCSSLPRVKRKVIVSCVVLAIAQDWQSLDILEEVVKDCREMKLQDLDEDNFEEFLENLKKNQLGGKENGIQKEQ